MQIRKFIFIRGAIVLLLILLCWGGWLLLRSYFVLTVGLVPTPFPLPNHVEIIVPESESLGWWFLSLEGDKIAYVSRAEKLSITYLLFLSTGQKHKLDGCTIFTWVDNTTLYCSNEAAIVISDEADQVVTIPLTRISAADVDWTELLQNAKVIYKFEAPELSHNLWLREVVGPSNSLQNYLIEGIENMDVLLQVYETITIPAISRYVGSSIERVYSPNNRYYYNVMPTADDRRVLTIYDATDESKITEFVTNQLEEIIWGGWAIDSSGVYYEVVSRGKFPNPTYLGKILKLKVPPTQ